MKNSDFITGRVPITKEEVRAVSIMKLDLVNAKRFIDVGAGTGSVSVEAAYNYPNLEVISIERNDDALDLINKNVEKFNLKNVEVIKAYAPIDIEGEVDAIFLGGTGNRLNEILLWSKEKLVPGGRLVANFIIVETFNETLRLLREYGFENIDVSVMNISKLEKECINEELKDANDELDSKNDAIRDAINHIDGLIMQKVPDEIKKVLEEIEGILFDSL